MNLTMEYIESPDESFYVEMNLGVFDLFKVQTIAHLVKPGEMEQSLNKFIRLGRPQEIKKPGSVQCVLIKVGERWILRRKELSGGYCMRYVIKGILLNNLLARDNIPPWVKDELIFQCVEEAI